MDDLAFQEVDTPLVEAFARLTWGLALADLRPPSLNEAEAQFAESLRLFELEQNRLWTVQTHAAWGTVYRHQGNQAAAREHWEQAAAQWEACVITWKLERVRALIAMLPEA